jgi:hypothetical protein
MVSRIGVDIHTWARLGTKVIKLPAKPSKSRPPASFHWQNSSGNLAGYFSEFSTLVPGDKSGKTSTRAAGLLSEAGVRKTIAANKVQTAEVHL